jgi:hypothetical protein
MVEATGRLRLVCAAACDRGLLLQIVQSSARRVLHCGFPRRFLCAGFWPGVGHLGFRPADINAALVQRTVLNHDAARYDIAGERSVTAKFQPVGGNNFAAERPADDYFATGHLRRDLGMAPEHNTVFRQINRAFDLPINVHRLGSVYLAFDQERLAQDGSLLLTVGCTLPLSRLAGHFPSCALGRGGSALRIWLPHRLSFLMR